MTDKLASKALKRRGLSQLSDTLGSCALKGGVCQPTCSFTSLRRPVPTGRRYPSHRNQAPRSNRAGWKDLAPDRAPALARLVAHSRE